MELLMDYLPPGVDPVWVVSGVVALMVVIMLWRGRRRKPQLAGTAKPTVAKEVKKQRASDPLSRARGALADGKTERAIELFVEAKAYAEAADAALAIGKKDLAASLYERAGKYRSAAEMLEEIRQLGPAAKLYIRAQEFSRAASLYERTGDFEKAAKAYTKDGDFRAAAELYVKRKDYPAAADAYRQVSDKILTELRSGSAPDKRARFLKKAAEDAARVFEKVRDDETAFALYEVAGLGEDAARIGARAGKSEQGAEALIAAGKTEEAIAFLENAGEHDRANRLRAQQFEAEGDLLPAAELYTKIGEESTAAELYITLGRHESAAEVMAAAGKYGDAAQYYLKAKNGRAAAECFAKAGLFDRAASLYQRLGQTDKAIAMLVQAGERYQAGLMAAKAGLLDKAQEVLDTMDTVDPDYAKGQVLRADIYLKQEQLENAREFYARGLADMDVGPQNLQSFYRYGVLLQTVKDKDRAIALYKRILEYDKSYRDVQTRIATLSRQTGDATPSLKSEGSGQKRRYVILDELGRGGMGVVYKAMDRTLDRVVALKVLPGDMRENKSVVDNFFREAKAAAGLNHTNIVTVFDAGEEEEMYYIAMEYIEGKTLKQIVKESGPFAFPHWLLIFGQVCKALDYAHQKKIVHRDIKPSNLMWLERDKIVKITDFGLAKIMQEVANFQTVIGGTPHYMSPEQILGEQIDKRADLYSLGATMYELATGSVPYPKGDAGYHHIHSEVPDPRTLRPDFPAAAAEIVEKCMAKDPVARYGSATDVLQALQAIREQI